MVALTSIIKTAIFWITAMLYFGLFKHSLTLDLQISYLVGYVNKIHIFLVYTIYSFDKWCSDERVW